MNNKQTITILVGIGIGLLLTSLFGLFFGPIWAIAQHFSIPHLYFWLSGCFHWVCVGGLIGSEREWIVKNPFMTIIASVIFCGVIGLFIGFFLGQEAPIVKSGFSWRISWNQCWGYCWYWGKRITNRFINVIANAMFLGSIGGFIGLYWGWNAVPEYKDVGAVAGIAFGVALGIIVGIIFGAIYTTQSEWIPRRYRRIINGIIIG